MKTPRPSSKIISDKDRDRLSAILSERVQHRETAARLRDLLSALKVIPSAKVPRDVVTMNSIVCGITNAASVSTTRETKDITLVYPSAANITDNCVSILTALGMQLLGSRSGDTIAWQDANGDERTMLIDKIIYQPEASGDWNL